MIRLSIGNSRMEKHWNLVEMELSEFRDRISHTRRTAETVEQYRKLGKAKQDEIHFESCGQSQFSHPNHLQSGRALSRTSGMGSVPREVRAGGSRRRPGKYRRDCKRAQQTVTKKL